MARPTNTDSRVTGLTRVRRDLEVRGVWRALFALVPAVIGTGLVTRGVGSAIAGVILLALTLTIVALPLFSPERVRQRLLAAASERVPDRDGWVTLVGVAGEAGKLLTAPYSRRPCIAYWARTVAADTEDSSQDAGTDSEQRAASCDFALDAGEVRVLITARDANLAFDRSRGEIVRFTNDTLQIDPVTPAHRGQDRNEEILLRPGERVVVRGLLVRGAGDAPYRATARIVPARGRPVVVALGAVADS